MAWMRQAVTAGYKKVANSRKDSDFDALRGRADFHKWIADLESVADKERN